MLKKSVIVFLAVIVVLSACIFTGCEQESIKVESVMNLDENFSGNRTVDIVFPLSVDIDFIQNNIGTGAPDAEGVKFEYSGIENDGYHFQLDIEFSSRTDYQDKVKAVIGRDAGVYLSNMDTVLAKGTVMKEDFDNSDLIYWIPRLTKSEPSTSSLLYQYNDNTVSIDGNIYTTGSRVDIVERTGAEINSITIDTTNSKDDTFDRTITFSIPNDTYDKVRNRLEDYFLENTMPQASYYGWANKGETQEYSVIYEDLTIDQLREYTGELLDTEYETVFYGDMDNDSTPLSEGLTFEENFSTFAFIGNKSRPVTLIYNYALPTVSTHGEGAVKSEGTWKKSGEWESGVYTAQISSDVVDIMIPDGIQYRVEEINFLLEPLNVNDFRRTTEFVYSKDDSSAFEYACSFFEGKGAKLETRETSDGYVCSVVSSGNCGDISDELVSLFGSGNELSYTRISKAFSLSDKTHFTDKINMGHLLSNENLNVPMTYTVKTGGDERIFSLLNDGKNVGTGMTGEEVLSADVTGGQAVIEYRGNIPKKGIIITFVTVFAVILMMSVLVIVLMNIRKKSDTGVRFKDDNSSEEDKDSEYEDRFKDAPFQTTMFKISDLMSLKNRTSGKTENAEDKETSCSDAEMSGDVINDADEEHEEENKDVKDTSQSDTDNQTSEVTDDLDEKISMLAFDENEDISDNDKYKVSDEELTKFFEDSSADSEETDTEYIEDKTVPDEKQDGENNDVQDDSV